jgi:hypothetical protein
MKSSDDQVGADSPDFGSDPPKSLYTDGASEAGHEASPLHWNSLIVIRRERECRVRVDSSSAMQIG